MIVVSGATGTLGRHVVRLLLQQGSPVRALARHPARLASLHATESRLIDLRDPSTLTGVCTGASALIIASGASMQLGRWRERSPFLSIDYLGHLRLLAEARRAAVPRIVALSLAGALAVRHTEYAQAHERFLQSLAESGTPHCVVRPTGFFAVFAALLPLARRGIGFVTGHGLYRTNPIHEADAARACVEALHHPESQLTVGGPETFTRARLAELPFDALSRPPRVHRVPAWLLQTAALPLGLANPRLAALLRFAVAAGATDLVAPAYGTLRLGDYLRQSAATAAAEPAPDSPPAAP